MLHEPLKHEPYCSQHITDRIVTERLMDMNWPDLLFYNMRVWSGAQKKFPFSPGVHLGGFGLLRNGGKCMLEIMGQAGVFPRYTQKCPNGTWMAGNDCVEDTSYLKVPMAGAFS